MQHIPGRVKASTIRCCTSNGLCSIYTEKAHEIRGKKKENFSSFAAVATIGATSQNFRSSSLFSNPESTDGVAKPIKDSTPTDSSIGSVTLNIYYCLVERCDLESHMICSRDGVKSQSLGKWLRSHAISVNCADEGEKENKADKVNPAKGKDRTSHVTVAVDKVMWVSKATIAVLLSTGKLLLCRSGLSVADENSSEDELEGDSDTYPASPLLFAALRMVECSGCSDFNRRKCSPGKSSRTEAVFSDFIVAISSASVLHGWVVRHFRSTDKTSVTHYCFPEEALYHSVAVNYVYSDSLEVVSSVLLVGCSKRSNVVLTTRSLTDLSVLTRKEILFGPQQRFLGITVAQYCALQENSCQFFVIALVGEDTGPPKGSDSEGFQTLKGKNGKHFEFESIESVEEIFQRRFVNELWKPLSSSTAENTNNNDFPDANCSAYASQASWFNAVSLDIANTDIRKSGIVDLLLWDPKKKDLVDRQHLSLSPLENDLSKAIESPTALRLLPRFYVTRNKEGFKCAQLLFFTNSAGGGFNLSVPLEFFCSSSHQFLCNKCLMEPWVTTIGDKEGHNSVVLGAEAFPLCNEDMAMDESFQERPVLLFLLQGDAVPDTVTDEKQETCSSGAQKKLSTNSSLPVTHRIKSFSNLFLSCQLMNFSSLISNSSNTTTVPSIPKGSDFLSISDLESVVRRTVKEENKKLLQSYTQSIRDREDKVAFGPVLSSAEKKCLSLKCCEEIADVTYSLRNIYLRLTGDHVEDVDKVRQEIKEALNNCLKEHSAKASSTNRSKAVSQFILWIDAYAAIRLSKAVDEASAGYCYLLRLGDNLLSAVETADAFSLSLGETKSSNESNKFSQDKKFLFPLHC